MGRTIGSSSSPKTVERTSSPAALHFRRFHLLTSSPSSSSSSPPSPLDEFLHRHKTHIQSAPFALQHSVRLTLSVMLAAPGQASLHVTIGCRCLPGSAAWWHAPGCLWSQSAVYFRQRSDCKPALSSLASTPLCRLRAAGSHQHTGHACMRAGDKTRAHLGRKGLISASLSSSVRPAMAASSAASAAATSSSYSSYTWNH